MMSMAVVCVCGELNLRMDIFAVTLNECIYVKWNGWYSIFNVAAVKPTKNYIYFLIFEESQAAAAVVIFFMSF